MEKKISELTEASAVNLNDSFVLNQGSQTKKVSMSVLNNSLNIPTYIQIGPTNIPTLIGIVPVSIPTQIDVFSAIPTQINIAGEIPPAITIIAPPPIDINWGTPPTIIANKSSGLVSFGTDVILGNLKVRIPSIGNKSLQLSTVSGTLNVYGSSTYVSGGVGGSASIASSSAKSLSNTPTYLVSSQSFNNSGDCGEWLLMDHGNSSAWKISFIISAFNSAVISIEKLV